MKRLLFYILIVSLFSCSTTKYKEQTKDVIRIDSVFVDSSKTTVFKLQNQLIELMNKDYTIYKRDSIIKIDSLYFRIPIETTIYKEVSSKYYQQIIDSLVQQNNILSKLKAEKEKETTVKDKKTFNFYLLAIPIGLIILIWVYFKKF